MDYKKALMLFLHEVNHSGLISQFFNEEFADYCSKDLDGIEFILQNTMLTSKQYIDWIKKRRELLKLDENNFDYSFEIQLCIDAMNIKDRENLEESYKSLAKKSNFALSSRKANYIEDVENFMSTTSNSIYVYEKNQDKMLELLNVIKNNDLINEIKHSLEFMRSKIYIDWAFENKCLLLQYSFENPEDIKDKDFILKAIDMNIANYENISPELKLDEDVVSLIINKIKDVYINDNYSKSMSVHDVGKVVDILGETIIKVDNFNKNNEMSNKYKNLYSSIGGYLPNMSDVELEVMLKIREENADKLKKRTGRDDYLNLFIGKNKDNFDYSNNVLSIKIISIINNLLQDNSSRNRGEEYRETLNKIFKKNKLCLRVLKETDDSYVINYITKKNGGMPFSFPKDLENLMGKIEYEHIKNNVVKSNQKSVKIKF